MNLQKIKKPEAAKMQRLETIIFLVFFLFAIASPFVLYSGDELEWSLVFRQWRKLAPYLLLLTINHFWTVPHFLFRKKRKLYIIVSLVMVMTLTIFRYVDRPKNRIQALPPSSELFDDRSPRDKPPRDRPPPPEFADRGPRESHPLRRLDPDRETLIALANDIVGSLFILLIGTGFRSTFRLINTEHLNTQLEKENVHNRLSFLKNQISPHFFMNTLNNVHSLIAINPEEAQEAVIKLSRLMRTMLSEPESGHILLKNEITFLKNYVELMSLRFNDKLELKTKFPSNYTDIRIPPMLFSSLVENAFKYGVSYKAASYIHIQMSVDDHFLNFEITNSNHKQGSEDSNGIGLSNTRDRLNLLYQSNFHLDVTEDDKEFKAKMSIPI